MSKGIIIDWLAVEMVCSGQPMALRYAEERRAVVRHFNDRMLDLPPGKGELPSGVLTATDVAALMGLDPRSVTRIRTKLRPAVRRRCPECREPMWVCDDGTVELHADRFNETCRYTYDVGAMAS